MAVWAKLTCIHLPALKARMTSAVVLDCKDAVLHHCCMSPSALKAVYTPCQMSLHGYVAVQRQTLDHRVRSGTVLPLAFHWGWRIAALTSPATRCRRIATLSWRISIACRQSAPAVKYC